MSTKIINGKECTLLEIESMEVNDIEKYSITLDDISESGKIKVDIKVK